MYESKAPYVHLEEDLRKLFDDKLKSWSSAVSCGFLAEEIKFVFYDGHLLQLKYGNMGLSGHLLNFNKRELQEVYSYVLEQNAKERC